MHCVDCSTYELALRGSEFELCARWKNVGYLAEQRPLAAVHFSEFSIQRQHRTGVGRELSVNNLNGL